MHSAEIENEFETPRLTAQGRTLLVPLQQEPDHAARGSRYEFWSQKAMDNAQGDSGSTRRAMASCESETQRGRLDFAALASRSQPENQSEMYRAQMKSKIRVRNEQIPELGQNIKRLVRLAYQSAPVEVKEQLARDCFIGCIHDADMEWAIFQVKEKSINNAIQVAYEYEAFQDDRRKHGTKLVCAVNENNNFGPNREIDLSGQIDDTLDCLAKIENNEKNKKTFS
ncbi:unnamed protein product [Mytilus coruscus]|uniref:Uncharacterized protein n=1 Tax=Mytilus coruscus TaxID=42192 RepID=A0A6J8ESR7_MYTCO|nr:unnamed protein product [Mytilus coruscus]